MVALNGRKEDKYVVGYDGDSQTIYGKHEDDERQAIYPMARPQAEVYLSEMPQRGAVIYKLVPVKIIEIGQGNGEIILESRQYPR